MENTVFRRVRSYALKPMLKSGTFVNSSMINESYVIMILEYTLFPLFSHCTEANVIWILTEFFGDRLLHQKFKWYQKYA